MRRGLYSTVPLGASAPSEWREDPWRVAAAVFAPCYIGGWSACEHWELTEQVFRGIVVITARSVRASSVDVQGTDFLLKHRPIAMHFGIKAIWRERMKVGVSDPSRTVVDLLDDPRLAGGIRHAASIIGSYMISAHRDEKKLIEYGDRLGNRTVFKRLGHVLEALSIHAPLLIEGCRSRVSKGLSVLDPTISARGRIVKRWGLRANIALAPEPPS